jgi:hypothetical protein
MGFPLFASAGPLTSVFEELATSIGSGLVVGSFVAGIGSAVVSRSRTRSEKWAVIGGYGGGALALALLLVDILGKHFV